MVLTKRNFDTNVDTPKRAIDMQKRLQDEAIVNKFDVKSTPLSRLHGVKTEVVYYEQIVSNRQGNIANTASLNNFDTNLTKFRRIADFVILTDELDANIDKDTFTNLTFEGSAKILPNTLIPNLSDYFVMKVFNSYHIFRIIEVNPVPIEKDSGYGIRFDLFKQDIILENCELNRYVKEDYCFDYNHVGTEFRTVLKTDEYKFIQESRNVMFDLIKVYVGTFYHKTLNTIMCKTGDLPIDINDQINSIVLGDYTNMTGNSLGENRTIYDINLVSFINLFKILSPSDKIHIITEHIKFDKKYYNGSIFSAIAHRDITRFINRRQRLIYMNSNLYNHSNRLYGRFLVEHDGDPAIDPEFLNLFPANFVTKLTTYNSDTMLNTIPVYTNGNDLLIDIISTFINEPIDARRVSIVIKLLNILIEKHYDYMHDTDFDNAYSIFYTYPLVVYVLKFMTREISQIEFK